MTYHDPRDSSHSSHNPTERSVDKPGPKWAWIVGLLLAVVLGFGIYSAFKSAGNEGSYPEALPAAGRDDPVDEMAPTGPDDANWPGPIQPQNPQPAPDRGG